jgi:hypothetical protein
VTTTVNLRKVLDRKQWEMCVPAPTTSVAGSFLEAERIYPGSTRQSNLALYFMSTTAPQFYRGDEDGWSTFGTTGHTGTLAAGCAGAWHPNGPTGTASAGTTTTLTTALTIRNNIVGYRLRLTGGTGAGQEAVVTSHTTGANAVLTFAALGTAPDATTTFLLLTGRWYTLTATTSSFRYYDWALDTWNALSVSGLTAGTTDSELVATPGVLAAFATGTATAGSTTTLTDGAKAWGTNQWTNYQVRITGGTGAGQVRAIASNTATVLTVGVPFTVTPDATSAYVVEGLDDVIYFIGNNATALFRYNIAGGGAGAPGVAGTTAATWTTLTVRPATSGVGASLDWAYGVTDPTWNLPGAFLNGRRIYSTRGNGSQTWDYYDIPTNAWTTLTVGRQGDTFSTGSGWMYDGLNSIYGQKDASGRFFRFNLVTGDLDPWSTLVYAQGTGLAGNRVFYQEFVDGATRLGWVYQLRNTGTELFRCLVI